MKKRIKRIILGVIASAILIFISLQIASWLSPAYHPLKKNKYDSIEKLHFDLVNEMNTKPENLVTDFYPRDMALYLNIDDKWFVFCSFSRLPFGEISNDALMCYVVNEEDGKFIFDSSSVGFRRMAELPLHSDYSHWSYNRYYMEWINAGESVGIAYKSADETRSVYYDGVKMEEIGVTNPLTNETFILCYAKSSTTYNVFQRLFISTKQRHSLELK